MKIKTTFVTLLFVLAIVGFIGAMIWFPWISVIPAAIAVWTGTVLVGRYKSKGKRSINRFSVVKVFSVILMVLCAIATVFVAICFGWWALLAAAAFLGSLIWFLTLIGKSAIFAGLALLVVAILFGVFCIQSTVSLNVGEINVDVINATKVNATEVNATKVNATEVKATEVKATQVKATEVKATEVNATEVKATEVKATEVKATEVNATKVNATKVNATEVNATKVNATEVNATKVNATEVNTTKPTTTTTQKPTTTTTTRKPTTTTTQKLTTTTRKPTTTTTQKLTTTTRKPTTTTTQKPTTTTQKPTTTTTQKPTATTQKPTTQPTTKPTTQAKNPSISVSTDYMQKGDTVIVTLKDASASDVVIKYVNPDNGSWVYGGASLKSIGNNQYRLIVDDSLFEMAVDLTLGIRGQTNYKMVTLEPCYD